MTISIADLRDDVLTKLQNDLQREKEEREEMSSMAMLFLYMLGGSVVVNQEESRDIIAKIISGKVGLQAKELDGDNIVKITLVELGDQNE